MTTRTTSRAMLVAAALLAAPSAALVSAQDPDALRLAGPGDAGETVITVAVDRGFAAVPLRTLERLGWGVAVFAEGAEARRAPHAIRLREEDPFFRWNDDLLQLTHAPYRVAGELWVPVQLIADFLPQRLEDDYAFESRQLLLRAKRASAWLEVEEAPQTEAEPQPEPQRQPGPQAESEGVVPPAAPSAEPAPPAVGATLDRTSRRVVIIDPGHGGPDPGTRGPGGIREKDVVLALALALARELEQRGEVDVHLTRATDRQVPPWERGAWATTIKGDRAGLFISIHANAGGERSARGFETYFLSEARTEHERRVAALENASFRAAAAPDDPRFADPGLDYILRDLNNLDHQHWSALLAEMVQQHVEAIHPGPNRGVKQGPLAVITNALMPAVLLEIGFISERAEERLLASREFQTDAASALADAIGAFFQRYPPGSGDEARR